MKYKIVIHDKILGYTDLYPDVSRHNLKAIKREYTPDLIKIVVKNNLVTFIFFGSF